MDDKQFMDMVQHGLLGGSSVPQRPQMKSQEDILRIIDAIFSQNPEVIQRYLAEIQNNPRTKQNYYTVDLPDMGQEAPKAPLNYRTATPQQRKLVEENRDIARNRESDPVTVDRLRALRQQMLKEGSLPIRPDQY